MTPGQQHYVTQAEFLVANITNSAILVDIGYDSNVLVEIIKANHSIAVIPSDKNRKELLRMVSS